MLLRPIPSPGPTRPPSSHGNQAPTLPSPLEGPLPVASFLPQLAMEVRQVRLLRLFRKPET